MIATLSFYATILAAVLVSAAQAGCTTVYVDGKRKRVVVSTEKPGPTLLPNPPVRHKKPVRV